MCFEYQNSKFNEKRIKIFTIAYGQGWGGWPPPPPRTINLTITYLCFFGWLPLALFGIFYAFLLCVVCILTWLQCLFDEFVLIFTFSFYPICAFTVLLILCDILYHIPNNCVISHVSKNNITPGWPCGQHIAIFIATRWNIFYFPAVFANCHSGSPITSDHHRDIAGISVRGHQITKSQKRMEEIMQRTN